MDIWNEVAKISWPYWIAGSFAILELFRWSYTVIEWIVTKFGFETRRSRQRKEWDNRLEKVEADIVEIKNKSKDNVNMFLEHEKNVVTGFTRTTTEILDKLNALHDKVDEQNAASNKTDLAILRDRIVGGMRYFSQNKDEYGKVHISFSDHENMEALFQEYFAKGGNGTIKNMYDNEFAHFSIDR